MTNQQSIDRLLSLSLWLDKDSELYQSIIMAISALRAQDSPKPTAESAQNVPKEDLISRKAAIDALRAMQTYKLFAGDDMLLIDQAGAQTELMMLPSAQHEIIHCKECKYGVQDEDERWYCRGFGCQVGEEDGNGFCADAERENNV